MASYQALSLDDFAERSGNLSKKTRLSLNHLPIPWYSQTTGGALSPQNFQPVYGPPYNSGSGVRKHSVEWDLRSKHGRGIANSQAFFPRLWWEKYPRGWARLPPLSCSSRWGSGVVQPTAHWNDWRKRQKGKGSSYSSQSRHCYLLWIDIIMPNSGMKTTLTHWTATAGDVLQPSVESNRQPLAIWKQPCNWLRFWWHLSGLPDTRQITEEGPAFSCSRAHSSAAGEMTCARLS